MPSGILAAPAAGRRPPGYAPPWMGEVVHLPPVGHYLANEVGRLAGVTGDQIGQWARYGYIRSSQSDDQPRVYSYQDVAEAMAVHQLRDNGVSYEDIRN